MELRLARTSDLPDIANLFLKCWTISYVDVLSQETREAMTPEGAIELWKKALTSNLERKTVLAIENEVLIGLFRVGHDPKDPLHKAITALGKSASISDFMNGDEVSINPKHADGKKALKMIKGLMK